MFWKTDGFDTNKIFIKRTKNLNIINKIQKNT